jgi:endo-1,4-beta-xylanase
VASGRWVTRRPFTRTLEISTFQTSTNSWDATVRFATTQSIAQGDVLLLVVWVRGLSSVMANGYVTHVVELGVSPWTKSLSLDQTPAPEWQQWMIPLQAALAMPAGGARYQLNVGWQAQSVEIAGLALINYGTTYTRAQLPQSRYHLDYVGHSPDAAWRQEALARIEQIRKADLAVRVVDKTGRALPGASVQIQMKRHAFGFGTALSLARMLGQSADDQTYRDHVFNLNGDGKTWSVVVFGNAMKWPAWENPWEGSRPSLISTVQSLRDTGIRVRGHCLVWPSYSNLPADIGANRNPAYVRARIADHIAEEVGYPGLKGEICEWDVLNEPAHLTDLRDLFGGEAVYAEWFQQTAAADPQTKLYINDYSIISAGGMDLSVQSRYRQSIETILVNGGRIDGIGVQGHMYTTLTGPERIYEVLNDFAGYGAKLSITEFDASGADPIIMGDYMRDILIIAFSHPQVENFIMWGFWDGDQWHGDAPLYNMDWSLKPAGQAFLDTVFNEWWTDSTQTADYRGRAAVRGFLGDYEITASYAGVTKTAPFTLQSGGGFCEMSLNITASPMPRYRPPETNPGHRR